MPLDDRIQEMLKRKGPFRDLTTMNIADLRARSRDQIKLWREAGVTKFAMDRCEDRAISTDAGEVTLRIYWPSSQAMLPIVIYIHGGGWVTCVSSRLSRYTRWPPCLYGCASSERHRYGNGPPEARGSDWTCAQS